MRALEEWVAKKLQSSDGQSGDGVLDALSKLTIVIPTYCRQRFILRQLAYWGETSANVIVVDGSPEPLSRSARSIITGLENFQYLHGPENYNKRLVMASECVNTPYVVTLPDDDLYLKGALRKAIETLDANPNLVACNGQVLGMGYESQMGMSYYDANYAFWRYTVKKETAEERLSHAMFSYNAVACYALLRREVWINGWAGMQTWASPYAGEIYQSIVTSLSGQVDTLDMVYMLRSNENDPVSLPESYDRKLDFGTWWLSPDFADEHEDFVCRLAAIAMDQLGLDMTASRKLVELAVNAYLAFCEKKVGTDLSHLNLSRRRAVASSLLRRVISPAAILALKRALHRISAGYSESKYVWQMFVRSNNEETVQAELQDIERLVREFYEMQTRDEELMQ